MALIYMHSLLDIHHELLKILNGYFSILVHSKGSK